MAPQSTRSQLVPTYAGSAAGLMLWAIFGALPGLLYGGYMGLAMGQAILGHNEAPSLMLRLVTGGGMVLGGLASLFLFLVFGALCGTLLGMAFGGMAQRATEAPQVAPPAADPKTQSPG